MIPLCASSCIVGVGYPRMALRALAALKFLAAVATERDDWLLGLGQSSK
jgi:hypothetical protein